jgi:vancomycin permeability regulator SanA
VGDDSFYDREIRMELRSLPLGILSDSITWNFTGWGYLTACVSLFLLSAGAILLAESARERREAYFSYRATGVLGLAIFLMLSGFFQVGTVLPFLRGENAGTVWALLVGAIVSAQTFMRWTAVVLGVFSLILAVSNVVLIRHEGFRPSNMLGVAVALLISGGAAFGIWMSYSLLTFPLRNLLLNVYAGIFVYLECLLTATVIHALMAGRHEPAYDRDYVIVLGCRIRPDGTLYPLIRARVDRAVDFVRREEAATGKRAVLIPSGGKGTDEPEAEAEAMARYMRAQGVPDEQILVEDRSKTTLENLRFSRGLIESRGDSDKVAFSTSNYHVYRGGILAAESGWNIDGMGSPTMWYFWPNAFLREFIGLLVSNRVQQFTAIAVIALLSAGLTALVM